MKGSHVRDSWYAFDLRIQDERDFVLRDLYVAATCPQAIAVNRKGRHWLLSEPYQ